jgi:serine/threonine protein kinase
MVVILYGLARLLAFSHGCKIIHRNLTPEKVFIDDAGHPHVAGFGFERQNASLAPEQQSGDANAISFPVDVYAYAVICSDVISSRSPHWISTRNREQVLREWLPPLIGESIISGLSRDQNERPTFREIVTAWENCPEPICDANHEAFLAYKAFLDEGEPSEDADDRSLETFLDRLNDCEKWAMFDRFSYPECTGLDVFQRFSRLFAQAAKQKGFDELPLLWVMQQSWKVRGFLHADLLRAHDVDVSSRLSSKGAEK